MSLPYKRDLIPRAKELRKNTTRHENHLWYDFLRSYPVRFQRQKTISSFIADFYCSVAKLIIELDGSQHSTAEGMARDEERDAILKDFGLKILRFSNEDIEHHFEAVCKAIHQTVNQQIKIDNRAGA